MKKILNIISSIKGAESFSIKLSNAILEKLSAVYPDSVVHTLDLTKVSFPHLEALHFGAFHTPSEMHTEEQKQAIRHSDEAINELMEADIIVIGVPLYNFSIPDTLKTWIDHIVRVGITFRYADGVIEGLVKGKKVYLAIASGGIYSEGPMKSFDFTEPYLRTVLGFIGLKDMTTFRIEGTMTPEFKDTAVPRALGIVNEFAF